MVDRTLKSSILLTSIGNAIPPILGLLSAPLLAQSLGAEGRGALAAAMAPVYICVIAFALGLPESVTYHVARGLFSGKRHGAIVAVITLAAGLGAVTVVFIAAPYLSAGADELSTLIRAASLSIIPSLLVGLMRGHAAGLQRWGTIALERILGAVLRVGALATLWITGQLTVPTALLCMAGGMFLSGFVYFFQPRHRTHHPGSVESLLGIIRYGTAVWTGGISGILLVRVDQALVVPLSDARQLGLYVVAVSVAEVILVFNSSVRDVIFARSSARLGDEVARAARVSTGVTLILGFVVAAGSFPLMGLVFGAEFESAKWLVVILIFATVAGNPGSVAGASLSGLGRPWLRSLALTSGLIVNVCLVFALVPTWGAVGAAWAMVFTNLAAGGLNVVFYCRLTGRKWRDFLAPKRDDFWQILTLVRSEGRGK